MLAACLVGAPAALAGELLSTGLSVPAAVTRSCTDRILTGGRGHARRSVTAPAAGWVTARLEAGAGDWDLAIYDEATGERVAGSAFFGASEVAQGFVAGGERLTVQACRRSGDARAARLTVDSQAVEARRPEKLSLVRVSVPSAARRRELTELGLDLTEHGGKGFVEVLLHGADDARRLREARFIFVNVIADLGRQGARDRLADRRYAASVTRSALPSARDSYRHLADYGNEMKVLVERNPGLVKPITLPIRTFTGMSVEGIEITTDVGARDGKPIFLQLGAHHAREWPSSEHAIEWAHELVNGYRAGNSRVRRLVEATRTIVVPVVNPEGFNTSREAASAMDDGRGGPDETPNLAHPYEYHRKNCRVNNTAPDDFTSTEDDDPPEGDCTQPGRPNVGVSQFGVDPNRNYGGFWGGPGAEPSGEPPFGDYAQAYRGNGPFSEPETQNIRDLISRRQVTTLITNHTFSNLILRPPGVQAQGPPVDEPVYKALGDSMAQANGYASQPGYQLYDTSGTTEDWSYYATGGLGFTFEIGPTNFHPPYADVVAEYDGTTEAAGGRGGNREAYFRAMESTADPARHSVIEGGAPAGSVLRLSKGFKTSSSPVLDADGVAGPRILFDDRLESVMDVPASGRFRWHANPSTRPLAAQGEGRPPNGGRPSPPDARNGRTAPQPACPSYFVVPGSCVTGVTDERFEVPRNGNGVDNGFATIRLAFAPEDADMDLEIYKADAQGEATGEPISSSAGSANPEQTTIGPDPAPGKYVARVINFAGAATYDLSITFSGPRPYKPPVTEAWTLTCETAQRRVLATRRLTIRRGQRQTVDFGSACPARASASASRRCVTTAGGVRATSIGRARLARGRATQRKALGARPLGTRGGIDRYCVQGGGTMRIGYPTSRLSRRLGRALRRRYARKAILIVTTSKRFTIRGVKVGTSTRRMQRLLRRERGYTIGRNRWYAAAGSRGRLVFSTRAGRVREMGLASKRLSASRRATARLLRAWAR